MEPEVKTPASRHYFYRKATTATTTTTKQQTQQQLAPSVLLDGLESANAFENKINDFIKKNALQNAMVKLRQDATNDLNRRKADRKARKEKEEQAKMLLNGTTTATPVIEVVPMTIVTEGLEEKQPLLLAKPSTLKPSEQNAWLANIHDDAMLMNPHQWLKLASLFNVNSKTSRQQSLINISTLDSVLQDRNIDKDSIRPLENYMELRDIQNRNYARDAVIEGIKYIKQNKVKEAMEYYKRALDMDPKYAEGWFHVAEGLVQQRKLSEAEHHLDRVLKLDSTHEGAMALLASIRRTIRPKKVEKGQEWDIVDERGQSINATTAAVVEEEDSKRKKRSSKSSKRSRSRDRDSKRKSDKKSSSSRRRDRSRSPRRSRDYDDRKSSRRDRSREDDKSSRRDRSSRRDEDRSSRSERESRRDSERRSRRSDERSKVDDKSTKEDDRRRDEDRKRRHRSSSRSRRDERRSRRDDTDKRSSRRDDTDRRSQRDDDDEGGRSKRRREDRKSKEETDKHGDKKDSKENRPSEERETRHPEEENSSQEVVDPMDVDKYNGINDSSDPMDIDKEETIPTKYVDNNKTEKTLDAKKDTVITENDIIDKARSLDTKDSTEDSNGISSDHK